MRIASISDIHSNYPALVAVLEDIKRLGDDLTLIVAGDFLDCGPFPRETLALLRQLKAVFIRGNHEDYLVSAWRGKTSPAPPAVKAPVRWTLSTLSQEDMEWIAALPERVELTGPDGEQVVAVHASPGSMIRGVFPHTTEAQLTEIYGNEIAPKRLFVHGHVHRPVLHRWRGLTIAGDGSVGQPLDYNTKACYLFAEWNRERQEWEVEHRRVAYDRSEMIAALERNAAYDEGGPYMKLIKRGFVQGYDRSTLIFVRQYTQQGDWRITPNPMLHLDQAIERFLAENPTR